MPETRTVSLPRRSHAGARRSAAEGAHYGLAYGLVETFHLSVLTWLLGPSSAYHPPHPALTMLLLALYPTASAGVAALLRPVAYRLRGGDRSDDEASNRLAAVFALSAVAGAAPFTLWEVGWRLRLLQPTMALAIVALHLAAARWPRRTRTLRPLASPWVSAVLLVTPAWAAEKITPSAAGAAAAALAAVTVAVVVALLADRFVRARSPEPRGERFFGPALVAASLLVAFGVATPQTVAHHPQPPVQPGAIDALPDIVLVTLDTVRADHLSIYGYPRDTTPELAGFARQATVYRHAIAPTSMTLGSHASIFTGLYVGRHGARYDESRCPSGCPLAPEFDTLAEILGRAGYRTAAVVSNYGYLGHAMGLDQGFETFDERAPSAPLASVASYSLRRALTSIAAPWLPAELSEHVYRNAAEIDDAVDSALDPIARDGRPFFLFVNYMDAHEPYRPPAPFDQRWPGKDAQFRRRDYEAIERDVLSLRRPLRAAEEEHLISQYDGGIAYLDSRLARLFDQLRRLGRFDSALVVIASDHGEAFGDRFLVGHNSSVYEDQIRVPLLIKRPHQRTALTDDRDVSLTDLFPTLLAAAGSTPTVESDGHDLFGPVADEATPVLSECFPSHYQRLWHPRFRRVVRAIYLGTKKLIVSTSGEIEAYELGEDPRELRPVDATAPVFAKLHAALISWLDHHPALKAPRGGDLDAATRDRLRALGYL